MYKIKCCRLPLMRETKFANYFETKVSKITSEVVVSQEVYNGKRKIHSQNEMFMTPENIRRCFDFVICLVTVSECPSYHSPFLSFVSSPQHSKFLTNQLATMHTTQQLCPTTWPQVSCQLINFTCFYFQSRIMNQYYKYLVGSWLIFRWVLVKHILSTAL